MTTDGRSENECAEGGGGIMKAQLCPVCNGAGKLDTQTLGTTGVVPVMKTCHGCGGKGWVAVAEDRPLMGELSGKAEASDEK